MKIIMETLLFVSPKVRFIDLKSLAKLSLRTTYELFIATSALQELDHILRLNTNDNRKTKLLKAKRFDIQIFISVSMITIIF